MAPTPGWYGKIPALGDFVSRRLPDRFVEPWDQWLQEALQAARQRFGPSWTERYLVSPLWRFALSPGVIDDGLWTGVLMPSVDAANRYFPFTVAQRHADALAPELQDGPLLAAWDRMAGAALAALHHDLVPNDLDQRLTTDPAVEVHEPGGSALVSLIRSETAYATLWFADGADRVSLSHVFDRLPAGDQAVVLLDGGSPDPCS